MGFVAQKTRYFQKFFFHIKNEIFYSNFLLFRRYIFDKDFVKFSKENIQNSVITPSFTAVPQKKDASVLTAEYLTGSSKVKRKKNTCLN